VESFSATSYIEGIRLALLNGRISQVYV